MKRIEQFQSENGRFLEEIFSRLNARLFVIEDGGIDDTGERIYLNSSQYYKSNIDRIANEISEFHFSDSLSFVVATKKLVQRLYNTAPTILEKFKSSPQYRFFGIGLRGEQKERAAMEELHKELDFYTSELTRIEDGLNARIQLLDAKGVGISDSKEPINPDTEELKSFGFRKDVLPDLCRIYRELILETGDFIDKEKTSEDTFIEILTAKKPALVQGAIYFQCETTQAGYILEKMYSYSKKFTFANIEKAKRFYSKQGKLVTANNLSVQRSKSPDPKEKSTIDKFFANLTLKQ